MGLQCYTTTEPKSTRPHLPSSRVFEGDIYKALVWQAGWGWLFYLPDLSCVTNMRQGVLKRVTVRADVATTTPVQGLGEAFPLQCLLGCGEGLM